MSRKKIVLTVIAAVIITAALASSSFAQIGKYGYIDSDKIFADWPAWTTAQTEFETEYKAWDDEAKEMQKALEELITEYEKQKLILSADKKMEREAAIDAKRQALDAFTREIFGPSGTAERKNNTLVKPLLEKINTAIENVATEENYDFIFNAAGLAYAKKEYDITDKVLEVLENE